MKKWLPIIAGVVLGGLFVMASAMFFLNMVPKMDFPEGSPISHFMAAFGPTGYMKFVKVFELTGGLLVMIPRLRNIGLLLLGPVIVNIVAFHFLIAGDGLTDKITVTVLVLALYLLWDGRKKFAGLLD
jgi:uncharacterized membrane protein YphA (DoxX/SURF4 family)